MRSNVIIFIGPNRADLAAGGGGANAPNAPSMATGLPGRWKSSCLAFLTLPIQVLTSYKYQ